MKKKARNQLIGIQTFCHFAVLYVDKDLWVDLQPLKAPPWSLLVTSGTAHLAVGHHAFEVYSPSFQREAATPSVTLH